MALHAKQHNQDDFYMDLKSNIERKKIKISTLV